MRTTLATVLLGATTLACGLGTVRGGCETLPRKPRGHVDIVRSAIVDSQLSGQRLGRLVATVNWSSESLAKKSRPVGTQVRVILPLTNVDMTRVVDSTGAFSVDLPAADEPYQVVFRLIGVQTLDSRIPVRAGFVDSARVFLGGNGGTLCP